MPAIEWKESKEVEPKSLSISEFCIKNQINPEKLRNDKGLLIFIRNGALESLYDFLNHDISREHGGVLVGEPFFDSDQDRYFINIIAAIPAQKTEGNQVHLQFTPNAWSFISGIMEENFPELMIVGWYHSHPGLGVFMSGTDRATQNAFFNHPWSLAIVIDPIAKKTGWFSGTTCDEMFSEQVIIYQTQKEVDKEVYQIENHDIRKLRWLLPFVSIAFLVVISTIWMVRKKKELIN